MVRILEVGYSTDDPQRELVERVVDDHLLESADIRFDPVDFRRAGQTFEKEQLDPSKDTEAGLFELDRYDPRTLE